MKLEPMEILHLETGRIYWQVVDVDDFSKEYGIYRTKEAAEEFIRSTEDGMSVKNVGVSNGF